MSNDAAARCCSVRRRTLLAAGTSLACAGCLRDEGLTGGSDDEPESLDYRGTITITIDGEEFDLTQDRFQAENADDASLAFHLHESDEYWYSEGEEPVTLAQALDLLPSFSFEGADDGAVLTIDEETYDSSSSAVDIDIRVNDESLDPAGYELQNGDDIVVRIETASE